MTSSICPYLYGVNLCALKKNDGVVRPIAVGSTISRLIPKIVSRRICDVLGSDLRPDQFGFEIKNGLEAAVHSARRYSKFNHFRTKVLLKIGLITAFNMVNRGSV